MNTAYKAEKNALGKKLPWKPIAHKIPEEAVPAKKVSFRKASPSRKAFLIFNYVLMTVVCLSCVLPFVHLLAVSLSSRSAVAAGKVAFLPVELTTSSYEYALVKGDFLRSLGNSLARTFLGTLLNLVLMILTAYPLSKGKDKLMGGKNGKDSGKF